MQGFLTTTGRCALLQSMKKQKAFEFFGSASRVAVALGVSASAVGQWGEIVPFFSANELHLISRGKVPLEPHHYGKRGRILKGESRDNAA